MKRPLILIPTPMEYGVVQPRLVEAGVSPERIQVCGFGMVASAARASQLIAQHQPDGVLLVGIAGSFASDVALGTVVLFDVVTCYGIGSGEGSDHVSAADMGWPQFTGVPRDGASTLTIGDTIVMGGASKAKTHSRAGRLLSVTSASANATDAARRRKKFPDAVAEDMEGYGVALACELAGVPLEIVRGISNQAGDRDIANWQMDTALNAAAILAGELLTN